MNVGNLENKLSVCHLNINSLTAHINEFRDYILDNSYDLVAVTETFLKSHIPSSAVNLPNYTLLRNDRLNSAKGGVAIYIRNSIKTYEELHYDTFECLWVKFKLKREIFVFGCVYKPPSLNKRNFIDKFESVIIDVLPQVDNFICTGDINLNLNLIEDSVVDFYRSMLESYGLLQIINQPTRVVNGTSTLIDHLIVSENIEVIESGVCSVGISDHELIFCTMNIEIQKPPPETHTYRNFKNIDLEILTDHLKSIPWRNIYDLDDIDKKVTFFNENLLALMDIHAPLKTIVLRKPYCPWITDNIKYLIRLRDKAKCKYRRTKKPEDFNIYRNYRNYTNSAIRREKKAYIQSVITNSNQKEKWKVLKNLNIIKTKNKKLPDNLCKPNEINQYFVNSIPQIKNPDLDAKNYYINNNSNKAALKLCAVTETVISKALCRIRTKAVGSDNLPVDFIIFCCPFILKYICHIVNFCIEMSVYPSAWKTAHVVPLPKTDCPMAYSDLRPVSILPVLSKVLEHVVKSQLVEYIEKYDILPRVQSGFRRSHSCATALLNVTDHIFREIDRSKCTILILLDYSKAFDMLDHSLLIHILKFVGLDKDAVKFIGEYLKDRHQRVVLSGSFSDLQRVTRGVPQGSILGPILFCIYTHLFPSFLNVCNCQMYADDTQLFYSFSENAVLDGCRLINGDLEVIQRVSEEHHLKLNPNKCVAMLFGRPIVVKRLTSLVEVNISNERIPVKAEAKNLGLILDSTLRFKKHVSVCIKRAVGLLRCLYNSRHMLNTQLKLMLCDAIILSIFNHCDVVYGSCLTAEDTKRIQKIQKYCLRFSYGIKKRNPVTYKLKEAKWIDMKSRRYLHCCTVYHKVICTKSPTYLFKKIPFKTDVHNINIRSRGLLTPPLHKTGIFERSFTYNLVKTYNNLPDILKSKSVKCFKKDLKHLLLQNT